MDKDLISDAQQRWGSGIVNIGKVFLDKGDFRDAAVEHIYQHYNYQDGSVLFKPTLVTERQFRLDFEGALSYFVGGNSNYPEDNGFAIRPWANVRWENAEIKMVGDVGMAMGNYFFKPVDGSDEVKVEYSFVYANDTDGQLKIVLHDSHLPFEPGT